MRFVFDTSVLIEYVRENSPYTEMAADAFFAAARKGEVFISLISLMELHVYGKEGKTNQKSNQQIREDINKVQELCEKLSIKIIC